ncbi:MAG: site-specific integrase [Desulforegulaceae bacterium]|nr:site-specific integrase [Desulforegulaceae bacterium]
MAEIDDIKNAIKEKTKAKIDREKGAGTLYLYKRGKEGKLSWVIRYFHEGKEKYYTIGTGDFTGRKGLSLKQAKDEYYKLKLLIREGKDLTVYFEAQQQEQSKKERIKNKKNISFKDFVSETYLPTAKIKKTERTYKTQVRHFEYWINPVIGKKSFDEITIEDCSKIQANMQKAGRKPRTIQHVFSTFHHVWQFALDDELTEKRCPTESRRFELEPVKNKKERVFSYEEERELLDHLELVNRQVHDLVVLGFDTGLRRGSLFKLQWQDIDFKNKQITSRGLNNKVNETLTIAMTERVFNALNRRLEDKNSDYVFSLKNGNPHTYTPSAFLRALKILKFNEGKDSLNRLSFHSLRHTFGTRSMTSSGNVYQVQKLLGHKQIETTLRYAHINDKQKKDAILELEKFNKSHEEKNIIPFRQIK